MGRGSRTHHGLINILWTLSPDDDDVFHLLLLRLCLRSLLPYVPTFVADVMEEQFLSLLQCSRPGDGDQEEGDQLARSSLPRRDPQISFSPLSLLPDHVCLTSSDAGNYDVHLCTLLNQSHDTVTSSPLSFLSKPTSFFSSNTPGRKERKICRLEFFSSFVPRDNINNRSDIFSKT